VEFEGWGKGCRGWSSAWTVRPGRWDLRGKRGGQKAVDEEDEMRWERMEKVGG